MHAQACFEIVPFFVAISWVYAIIWMEEKLAIIFLLSLGTCYQRFIFFCKVIEIYCRVALLTDEKSCASSSLPECSSS